MLPACEAAWPRFIASMFYVDGQKHLGGLSFCCFHPDEAEAIGSGEGPTPPIPQLLSRQGPNLLLSHLPCSQLSPGLSLHKPSSAPH